MAKSREFVEGFKSALNLYAWVDNDKRLRVGMANGGTLLTDAIQKIENELEPESQTITEDPVKEEFTANNDSKTYSRNRTIRK